MKKIFATVAVTIHFIFSGVAPTQAQSPAPVEAMPSDLAALMLLAGRVNGLDGPGMKPWHIKLNYQIFDEQGKPKEEGTFEEWWAAPDKNKQSYASSTFHQTSYETSSGRYREGDANEPSFAELAVRDRLLNPMAEAKIGGGVVSRLRNDPFPNTILDCVELISVAAFKDEAPAGVFPMYCFEPNQPMLRFSGSEGTLNTQYLRVGKFNGRYVGAEITITDAGKLYAKAQLTQGNFLDKVDDADFLPPATAAVVAKDSGLKAKDFTPGKKISGEDPISPHTLTKLSFDPKFSSPAPSADDIYFSQHKTALGIVIDEEGYVRQVTVLSAPDGKYAFAAIRAVHTWRYQPFRLHGLPIAVHVNVEIPLLMFR